jgi:hypothetical protein
MRHRRIADLLTRGKRAFKARACERQILRPGSEAAAGFGFTNLVDIKVGCNLARMFQRLKTSKEYHDSLLERVTWHAPPTWS